MSSTKQSTAAHRVLIFPLAVLAILIAIASFLPDKRLWGVNHLAYYPLALRLAALGLIAASFVPLVGRSLYATLSNTVTFVGSHRYARVLIVVLALACGALFYGFKSSSLLLGDGHLISKSYDLGLEGDSTMVPSSVRNIVKYKRIEPGASILYFVGAKGITAVAGGTATDAIRLFNIFLGVIFVFVLLWIILRSTIPLELRLWLAILVFASGTMELFFGYIEYYTPLVFFGTFYVITAWRVIRGRGAVWIPIVLAVMCAYIHIQAILLWPALVLLVMWRFSRKRRKKVLRHATPTLVIVTAVAVYYAATRTPLQRFFLPPFATDETYGVLSPVHWADIANEVLIIFPTFALFACMAFLVRGTRVSASKKKGGWFTQPIEWHFAGLLLYPCVLYLVLFNPEIGMARDWDLFTIAMFGFVPTALLVLGRMRANGKRVWPVFTAPAFVMSAILTLAWIGINASPVITAQRFENILDYDQSRSDYAYETLSRHYYYHNRIPEAIAAQEKAVAISKNPRQIFNLSVLYKEYGDKENEKRLLRQILSNRPGYTAARHNLILELFKQRRYPECAEVAREGIEIDPTRSMYHFFYGKCLVIFGRLDEGEASLLEARRLGVPEEMDAEITAVLAQVQRVKQSQNKSGK